MDDNPILRDLETAVEYGMGTDEVWHIPESAQITLGPDRGTCLLDGAVFTFWTED